MEYALVDKRRTAAAQEEHNFWDHHHEIVRRLVLGQKAVDIAKDLNIHPQTVSNVRNSPLVKAQIAKLQSERNESAATISERIKEISAEAVDVLEQAMSDADSPWNVRVSAAKDILDRAGHAPVQRRESVTAHLTLDEINAIKARAKNSGLIAEGHEEVPFEEVKEAVNE